MTDNIIIYYSYLCIVCYIQILQKKKYQNPSFYYKITEEMFDDITPIE